MGILLFNPRTGEIKENTNLGRLKVPHGFIKTNHYIDRRFRFYGTWDSYLCRDCNEYHMLFFTNDAKYLQDLITIYAKHGCKIGARLVGVADGILLRSRYRIIQEIYEEHGMELVERLRYILFKSNVPGIQRKLSESLKKNRNYKEVIDSFMLLVI